MNFLEEQMQKVARLTEEQLETVRLATVSARDMELRLAEEQRRVRELEDEVYRLRVEALDSANQTAVQSSMQATLDEERIRSAELEARVHAVEADALDAAMKAATEIAEMETRLFEEQRHSAELRERIAQLEPIAACASKFREVLVEMAALPDKTITV